MDEDIIKTRLIPILSNNFDIIEEPDGICCIGNKKVRADLALIEKKTKALFIIEIKSSRTKNFKRTELFRQATNYRYSKFNGEYPQAVIVVTEDLLINGFLEPSDLNTDFPNRRIPEAYDFKITLSFANKIGIGVIQKCKDKLIMMIGSRKIWEYDTTTKKSEFLLKDKLRYVIGTKAKSNKIC